MNGAPQVAGIAAGNLKDRAQTLAGERLSLS